MALPLLAMGIPALLSGISGIMGIVDQAKRMKGGHLRRYRGGRLMHRLMFRKRYGGRLRKHKYHKHKRYHRGKGMAADIISQIPLLGGIAGPIVRALGGRLHHKGYHKIVHTLYGPKLKYIKGNRGHGLAPMYMKRPYTGCGMLYLPGVTNRIIKTHGGRIRRHKKVHRRHGRGLIAPAGGYLPYR
jgi:hypothetical protein